MRKGKIKAGDGGNHQPEEVAAEFRSNPICPTRKFWTQSMRYKYPSIHCPLGVGDSWETQREREEISRVSPMKSYFSNKWVPPLSDGYQWSQDQSLDIDLQARSYELNQYNPYTTWNSVNVKPVFWYNQS
jgi:hypothetical protein